MVSGPGAEEDQHFVRVAEISSAVRAVQSAKGRRIEGRGITVPLPVYNRNQGNIERGKINVYQTEVQLAFQERRVETELIQALKEYQVSGQNARRIREKVMPPLERAFRDRLRLFQEGEISKFVFLDSQRKYNEMAKAYLDASVRHRRSMLTLNTVVGQRILP